MTKTGSSPDLILTPSIIRDIREQQEWAAPWGKASWALSVKQGGQHCPRQQGPNPTIPKPDEQSRFGCINQSKESLKHQAKLKWWRMSKVKLGSQFSKCGSHPLAQPSSVPLQGSQAGLGWEDRSRFLKCKPGSQVSRSGSGSAGYISRHRHSNTELSQQPRTRAWAQTSQQRRGEASHSSLSWGYAAVPFQHSSTGDRIQRGKSVPRTWGNHT